MMPKWHIFYGGIFSILFSLFFDLSLLEFFIVFLSSWLFIDLDSVLLFVVSSRSVNPFKFWNQGKSNRTHWVSLKPQEKRKLKLDIRIFHSIEFLAILLFIAFLNPIFFLVLAGFLIHLFLDWADHLSRNEEIIHKTSIIWTLKRNKNKKKFKH
jgi:hypothetical protein